MTKAAVRSMLVIASLVTGLAALASAQSAAQPDQNSVLAALLTEVRAMRAEIAAAASSSIRAQLLIGRLQLQEQRMNTVSAQLAETRRTLSAIAEGQAPMLVELRRLEDTARGGGVADPAEQKAAAQALEQMQSQSDQLQRQEQELRAQESELAAQLATEQGRWMDFNARLDEIERSLAAR